MNKPISLSKLFLLLVLFANGFEANGQQHLNIIDKTVNIGMRAVQRREISAIIIHSTFNNSGGDKYDIDLIIKQFNRYKVSSHYVIGRDGSIFRLVSEKNIAYQAGKSRLPDARTNVNATSIGIELMTSFDESPTEQQIRSLVLLTNDIRRRYRIDFVLRHSDIAPGRKTDPWNMDWMDFLKRIGY
ncbi:MAG TPA: N-acetylmuramoyl-L-alanine amidase [Paludibacter sp.]|nr:N-acetylmuramoyl-L-alanine amidase [Paludibacter sp.]